MGSQIEYRSNASLTHEERSVNQATMGGAGATTTRNSGGWSCILTSDSDIDSPIGVQYATDLLGCSTSNIADGRGLYMLAASHGSG